MANDMTFESSCTTPLETLEWDRTWIDHTNDFKTPRVLYIGDSISWGLRPIATAALNKAVRIDGLASSKALDNPFFKQTLQLLAAQLPACHCILFNNGLHGWHLEDEREYPARYREMIGFIKTLFPKTPLAIVLTTHVANEATEKRVALRNRAAKEIAAEMSLPIIDLEARSAECKQLFSDGVHFQAEGYQILGEYLAKCIQKMLALA